MNNRHILLAGASALALTIGLSSQASAQGNFVFGSSANVVSATTAQTVVNGAITSLSAQLNSALQQEAAVESNSATTLTGTTISGGPSATSSNIMSATAVANQFSNGSGATYVIDPSGIPSGGHAVVGTSQLNLNEVDTTTIARLGSAGATTASAPAGSWVFGANVTVNFTVTDGAAAGTSDTWTVTGVTGTVDGFTNGQTYTYNSTANTLTRDSDSVVIALGSGNTTTSTGANAQIVAGAYSFPGGASASLTYGPQTRTASTAGGSTGATGNEVSFTAGATYGAPVAVNANTLAARTNGNLALSSISGGLPLAAIASGPATLQIDGLNVAGTAYNATGPISAVAPTVVGANVTVNAPVSVSNIQQNVATQATTGSASETAMTASVTNSLVSALFSGATGTVGYSNGTVTASSNAITATATGNSGTVSVALDGTGLSTFSGGAVALTAQGNTAAESSTLAVSATNTNTTLRVQVLDSGNALQQISNANAALSSNTVSSTVALNELTAQSLTTAGTLRAQGSNGTTANADNTVINPQATGATTTSATITADYMNFAYQNNAVSPLTGGTVSGSATTTNAVIGFFGGVANGQVDLQANAVTASTQGNNASLTTALPWVDGTANSVTGAYQNNLTVDLTGTVAGTQIRISDNSALTADLTTAQFSSVATATTGSTFNNANLTIGSATSSALGNAVRSTVFGNNATATATIGQADLGGATLAIADIATTNNFSTDAAFSNATIQAPTLVVVGQSNFGTDITASVTHPSNGTGNYLFQIDAFQGLANGIATIGNNVLRATAAGNVGGATATVSGAAGNTIGGGVAVVTGQGNVNSTVTAMLGGGNLFGPTAVIGVDSLSNATAQVLSNTFAAVGVGNSATSTLTLPTGTIAGGTASDNNTQIDNNNEAEIRVEANYAVSNIQNNVASGVVATTLNAADLVTFRTTGEAGLQTAYGTNGYFPNRLNVGAVTFTNATGTVGGNTISTTAVGNEFYGTANGFVAAPAAGTTSSGTYSALALNNQQVNRFSTTTNTSALSINAGNIFQVASALSATTAIAGNGGAAGTVVDNSILSVSGNTASAAATLNSASLTATGIAISGADGFGQQASLYSEADAGSTDTDMDLTGPVTIANNQFNRFGSATGTLAAAGASTSNTNFLVNWTATAPATSSQFNVNSNTASAAAIGNTATLAATLAAGPAYPGGVGVASTQLNMGTQTTSVPTTSSVMAYVGTSVEFLAGYESNLATTAGTTSNSTVSVSGNAATATATLNQAALSLTAPSGVIIQGTYASNSGSPTRTAQAYTDGSNAEVWAQAALAVGNTQESLQVSGRATAEDVWAQANAAAIDGTVVVDSNTISATARGNTATASLPVSRLDTTLQVVNAQRAATLFLTATADSNTVEAVSAIATVNSTVSVSGNSISAASTVNNYAASVVGLGQSGSPTSAQSVVYSSGVNDVNASAGDVAVLNAQSIRNGSAVATASNADVGINLTNLTASNGTSNSTLTVSGNAITSSVNGNVASQSVLANGPGAANSRGGFGIGSVQETSSATLTALTDTVGIYVTQNGGGGATYEATNSPVSVTGNTAGSSVAGNSTTLSMAFGSALRASGTGGVGASSFAGGNSQARADYTVLNQQESSSSALSATTTNVTARYSGTASGSPVNVTSNVVFASAFGNSTSMAMTAPLAGGSVQLTNYQRNNGGSVNAYVSGTTMSAAMSAGASVNAPINVTGNIIRAVSVGNSAGNTIGR